MTDPKRAAGGASRAPRGGAPHQRGKRTGGQIALGLFKWIGILALTVAVLGVGAFVFIYANTTIPKPNDEFQTNVSTVYYADGEQPMSTFFVQNRQSIPLSEMPENVKQAIVAAENETFWEDRGISVPGLLRAVQTALTPGVDTVGGSTITQQYVKVRYLTQDKTITRKLTEIMVALKVNQDLTKEEILEGYLNTVYFGRGAYGIQTAAQAYFSKDAKDLDDQQAIALSAIVNAPNHLDPARGDKQRADLLERYQYTINQMVKVGYMTEARKDEIYTTLPDFPRLSVENRLGGPTGYLVNKVKDELRAAGFDAAQIEGGGLKIITTIDKRLQDAAATAAANMAERIAKNSGEGHDPLWYHPAIASVDTKTGAILAEYNGPDFVTSEIPWAETPRPTGSTFKPWALVAGLREGATLNTKFNGRNKLKIGDSEVSNAGGGNYGSITLQDMTTKSVNTAYVDMTMQMDDGPRKVAQAAIDAGALTEVDERHFQPSIALGYLEVSPLNAARALATLVNEGKRSNTHIVAEVRDMKGEVIYQPTLVQDQTIEPDIARNAAYALTKVVEDGTARGVRSLGYPTAGKTGTYYDSNKEETRSTWFIGATQQISTAVVLTGGEQGISDLGGNVYGSTYTAPGWLEFMKVAMEGKEKIAFPGPTRMNETGNFTSPPTPRATATSEPTASETPSPEPTPEPTPEPEPEQSPSETPSPEPPKAQPTPSQTPGGPPGRNRETPGAPGGGNG